MSAPPLATMPMYDWPETDAARAAFWAHVRDHLRANGVDAPDALSPGTGWREPGLVFSQTCGWPWATAYAEALDLVAMPVLRIEGCAGSTYSSAVVVPRASDFRALADLRGGRVAYNGMDSQSGVHTLRAAVAGDAPFFGRGVESGAHRQSLRMVARGEADCAAIDAVCWAMAQKFEPEAVVALRVVHWTDPAPALPFVTRRGGPVGAVRDALESAVAAGLGAPLLVHGLADPDAAAYRALPGRVAEAPELFPVSCR